MRRSPIPCLVALVAAALLAGPWAEAAARRRVTIEVRGADGSPVAQARVLVAADEMDAVGTTDAEGRVVVETASARIQVVASKGGQSATVESAASQVSVTLPGGAK